MTTRSVSAASVRARATRLANAPGLGLADAGLGASAFSG
jgi:hypothetical protein